MPGWMHGCLDGWMVGSLPGNSKPWMCFYACTTELLSKVLTTAAFMHVPSVYLYMENAPVEKDLWLLNIWLECCNLIQLLASPQHPHGAKEKWFGCLQVPSDLLMCTVQTVDRGAPNHHFTVPNITPCLTPGPGPRQQPSADAFQTGALTGRRVSAGLSNCFDTDICRQLGRDRRRARPNACNRLEGASLWIKTTRGGDSSARSS